MRMNGASGPDRGLGRREHAELRGRDRSTRTFLMAVEAPASQLAPTFDDAAAAGVHSRIRPRSTGFAHGPRLV